MQIFIWYGDSNHCRTGDFRHLGNSKKKEPQGDYIRLRGKTFIPDKAKAFHSSRETTGVNFLCQSPGLVISACRWLTLNFLQNKMVKSK